MMRRSTQSLLALLLCSLCSASQAQDPLENSPIRQLLHGISELIDEGEYSEAATEARALLDKAQREYGAESLQVAAILDVLVDALYNSDSDDEAELIALARRAVDIKEQRLDAQHPEVATSLGNLGRVLQRQHQFEEARQVLTRALRIRESIDPNDLATADALANLALVVTQMGHYRQAKPLYERDLSIATKQLPEGDPRLGRKQYNLARLYKRMGNYDLAEASYQSALDNIIANHGDRHPGAAYCLNGLGALQDEFGNYTAALELYTRALDVARNSLGERHALTVAIRNNMGLVYRKLGNYSKAREIYENELKSFDDDSDAVDRGTLLGNLTNVERLSGNPQRALEVSRQALAIVEKAVGPKHTIVATILFDQAAIWNDLGEFEKAKECLQRSLQIRIDALGEGHHDVAGTLAELAAIDHEGGQHELEKQHFERALTLYEETLGMNHPDLVPIILGLGSCLIESQQREDALQAALRAETISRDHIQLISRGLQESSALRYSAVEEGGLSLAMQLAMDPEMSGSADVLKRTYDALIRSRALVFDEMATRRRVLQEVNAPDIHRLQDELRSASQVLSHILLRGPEEESETDYVTEIKEAQAARDDAERALAHESDAYRERMAQAHYGLADVVDHLPAASALVSFVLYMPPRNDASKRAAETTSKPKAFYAAFVLRAGTPTPVAVPIGSKTQVDHHVEQWMGSIAAGSRDTSRVAEGTCRLAGAALGDLIWKPLQTALQGADLVFIVPDGSLNLVSFAALPVGTSRYLADTDTRFHYLSCERDLVPHDSSPGKRFLVVGDPDFDATDSFAALVDNRKQESMLPDGFRGPKPDCDSLESTTFPRLPGADLEAREVAALWEETFSDRNVVHVTGARATEAFFKAQATGSNVIHLSTHGFFLGACATSGQRAVQGLKKRIPGKTIDVVDENPLVFSGLVLAGANHRAQAAQDEEDGILTGEEISALNLGSVDWAVLSACGTGLGKIEDGEGVLGLRRAFRIAGARTLIMSLWSVSDTSTRDWMLALYRNRLKQHTSTADAVWESNRSRLEQLRQRGQSTHPFLWAAFVAAGEWR